MPHIIVEYSEELKIDCSSLGVSLHQALSSKETIKEESVKTRFIAVSSSIVGTEDMNNLFVHVCLKLLRGRSNELRNAMSKALYDILVEFLPKDGVYISVETAELHFESYIK